MCKHLAIAALALLAYGRTHAGETGTMLHASLKAYPNATVSVKDKATGITAYIESDGRHLAGLSHDGKLLWNYEVIKEGFTCVGTPVIRHLKFGKNEHKNKLFVTFCKHDYGEVDLKSYAYRYRGSD